MIQMLRQVHRVIPVKASLTPFINKRINNRRRFYAIFQVIHRLYLRVRESKEMQTEISRLPTKSVSRIKKYGQLSAAAKDET